MNIGKSIDVVSIGEILIDFIAQEKGTPLFRAATYHRAAGGGPANVAVGVARLGRRAAFVGKVGQDPFGEYLTDVLSADGVLTAGLVTDPGVNTTLVFASLSESAQPEFFFFRRGTADTALQTQELPLDLLRDTRLLHFSSVALSVEPARSACLAAVRVAREAMALIAFDPNLRLSLWPDEEAARREIMAAAAMADIVKMNEDECLFLTGKTIDEAGEAAAMFFANKATRLVAVTQGSSGAVLVSREGKLTFPAWPVDVVDTTGAGDAFMAGMLAVISEALASGDDFSRIDPVRLETLGRWGNATAALSCTKTGGIPSLPVRNRVVNLLTSS